MKIHLRGPLILAFLIMSVSINSQPVPDPADSSIPVVKCIDFELTGDGSNAEWNKTKWQSLTQHGTTSPYSTRFKILYSDSGIYCLYDCEDSKISATMKGNNLDLWNEDVIEAFFWADESVPVYFEYELSPLNYELVLIVPNYKGRFLGWIPWHYEGSRMTRHAVSVKTENDKVVRWFGEFYIPYELMRPMVPAIPESGTKWRANFYRIDYDDTPGGWSWMPVVKNFHDYLMFGTIEFQ